uniref:MS139, putative GGDEF family protein n=1 Tax=Microscilla sp. PRE1 TaxID=155537 RepID=Q93P92_9BACT|nr:transcriptional regulator [Microscilla sp. PRE1]AAK62861.1 MS139, putative GGDEF family protein [Microscilla sp. PRE1]
MINSLTRQGIRLALLLTIFKVDAQIAPSFITPTTEDSLQQEVNEALLRGDTVQAVQAIANLADLHAHTANYSQSYDRYWEGLLLAEQIDSKKGRAIIYTGLGWLYSFYGQSKKSAEYFHQSNSIYKDSDIEEKFQRILENYYALATLYRKLNEISKAEAYLDSAWVTKKTNKLDISSDEFILSERGYLLCKKGEPRAALEILNNTKTYFLENDPSYLIILYPFLGDIHRSLGSLDVAEQYYKKAVDIAGRYQSHQDLIPDIYEGLSEIYAQQRKYEAAFDALVLAKQHSEIQYGIRSESNQGLLEIKDTYRQEKERREDLIQQQRLDQLEQENQIAQLQRIILIGTIVFLVILGFLIYRYIRSRYKAEKRFLQHQRALELEKANEVLAAKNKELTASALHALEREELLSEIKEELIVLKKNPDMKEVGKLVKSIDLNTTKSWEEFEIRFLSVHEGFYNRLRERFPKLSQSDHKLCALIKLNFSSKDISRLLGISIESVHTTRYRLRKKLGLQRSDNLEDFIAGI